MNVFFSLLAVQIVLGAFDNLWHHEITEKLPSKRSARGELKLHATRELLYSVMFVGLAWYEWHGAWALVLGLLLLVEVIVTIADFLVEDRTRHLPPLERVLHTVLAINAGALLAVLAPILWNWLAQDTDLVQITYGTRSVLLSAVAIGIGVWGVRNLVAVVRLGRPAAWQAHPILVGHRSDPRGVLVTGGTGFIGRHLVRRLVAAGDRVIVLSRERERAEELFGPSICAVENLDEIATTERIDAIINLAGAAVANWPWTRRRRRILLASRLQTTRGLIKLINRLDIPPRVMVSASAVGFYGIRHDAVVAETSERGDGFQADLCALWERMAARAEQHGVRVVKLRIGLVLGSDGGILPRLTQSMRFGIAVVLGSGRQWMPWIHIEDLLRLIERALDDEILTGPVNAVALRPVRHAQLVHSAAGLFGCRLTLRVPAFMLRSLLGEMSELLVEGQRVVPSVAIGGGFQLKHPHLDSALRDLLTPAQAEPARDHSAEPYDGAPSKHA